ncbi:DNA double-strand break repair nuclease NurA [Synechococcus sp. PCC 7336]|uniref:DNA double-strand break repair nuclease NurA n=1 Tax=Synechococcus sp. PCC 7336 TaxID=195250 RepID=UPI0004759637|nr:DNA double-strand break repair nuclease NurA [Synechococcus sp. PCC 7336]
MALKTARVIDLLDRKHDAFANFDSDAVYRRQLYQKALRQLLDLNSLAIAQRLAGETAPGALPTSEWDRYRHWRVPFKARWNNREESLKWVGDTIEGVPTFAVDGSQLCLGKDVSIPVALVQVGWYENHHCQAGSYDKDIWLEVLAPDDLEASSSGEPREQRVHLRRFQLECDRLVQYLRDRAGCDRCLTFFDGALVATFAEAYDPSVRKTYVQSLLPLLRASEDNRVPLVAYVDTTYTRDLTAMLKHLFDLPDAPQIHDAQLIDSMLKWGDRTPLFICARGGSQRGQDSILTDYAEMRDRVGFIYLKTNGDNYPVRLELPLWMHEAGLLDWVVDIVRCEVIIGKGYPYAIETADRTAVLRAEDRSTFMRVLQDWSQRHELDLRLSRKMTSKLRRRRVR